MNEEKAQEEIEEERLQKTMKDIELFFDLNPEIKKKCEEQYSKNKAKNET